MRKFLLLVLSLTLLTSCQLTEEVTFDAKGSGIYSLNIDMSQMMAMGNEMSHKNDSLKSKKIPEKKDTIISIAKFLEKNKDSIKKLSQEEQAALNALKDAKIRIALDEAKDQMLMQYIIPFKNVKDLSTINDKLKQLNKLNKNKTDKGLNDLQKKMPQAKVTYKFSKHKFRRIVTPASKKAQKTDTTKNDQMTQMLGMFSYKLIYHFPYKIKSVSYDKALLTADGKTLIIEMPMNTLVEDPELLDFEVRFE